MKDELNNTDKDFIVSSQYTTIETTLTGLVKVQGTDYKTLKELKVDFDKDGRKSVLTIVRNQEFWNGEDKFSRSIVPIRHSFPEGSAVLLLPTINYDRTKSPENQPENAYFPVKLKKNYFSFSQLGPITDKVNKVISDIKNFTTAGQVDNLAVSLKQLLLTDYMLSTTTRQILHINPYGIKNGVYTEIDRKDENLEENGQVYSKTPIAGISFVLRTTDEKGNEIGRKNIFVPLKLSDGTPHPNTDAKLGQLKTFLVDDVRAKYQVKRKAIVDDEVVNDLVENDALSVNVESPEMLDVKSNRFKLTASKPEDIKRDNPPANPPANPPIDDKTTETKIQKESKQEGIASDSTIEDLGMSFFSDEAVTPQRERYTQESLDRELANLERMLPNLTKQQRLNLIDSLIPVVVNGRHISDAGGKFSRGIITLSRCAMIGTAYHEAFHAVFHLMLTNAEKSEIIDAAKQVWGNLSLKELEEKLAEGFREYSMTRDEYGLGKKILNFFKRLLGIVDNWNDIQPVFNDLYRNIYEGKYGNRTLENDYSQEMVSIKQKAIADGTFSREDNDIRYSIERYYGADVSSPKAQKFILNIAKLIKPAGKGLLLQDDNIVIKDLIKKEANTDFYTINRGTDLRPNARGYMGTSTRAEKVLAIVKRKLNELGILNAFEFVPYGSTYKVGVRFDDIKNPKFVDNPTTLSDEVYASLSPRERETARRCHSK